MDGQLVIAVSYAIGDAEFGENFGTDAAQESSGTFPSGSLSDDAFVVRGGLNQPETLEANLGTEGGISANSANGITIDGLAEGVKNLQIGVTTAGEVRAIGGDVIPTPIIDGTPDQVNPFHVSITLGPGGTQQLSTLFTRTPNPWVGVP